MSKFCKSAISEPTSTFLYVDLMASMLLRDTQELEADFHNKMEFVREQEQNCLQNEQNLIIIDKFVNLLKTCLMNMELEMHRNECAILDAERSLRCMDECFEKFGEEGISLKRSSYMEILKLLVSADSSTELCNNLKNDIDVYKEEVATRVIPHNLISSIIAYHNKALEGMERQVNELELKVNELADCYEDAAQDVDLPNLGDRMLGEKAEDIKDVFEES
ncbi:uncharacterized protein LOC115625524 [Scaptodrosophila lebanonensis]|uniref:Uncharacterized protein LOC115625524 n=1 Tax=Drosophila lebanonensis TaxID=7225 RepID=A0A6J2TMS2_DROLE|nr:uncharacterized protein LOC115625524 [Scaptodrosophila lebanonensis]